jgi:hypothetical protein
MKDDLQVDVLMVYRLQFKCSIPNLVLNRELND